MSGARRGAKAPRLLAQQALSPEDFRVGANVSRETLAALEVHADLLRRWQSGVNLVSRASLADLWRRHFLDSAQLLGLAPPQAQSWVDIGSGAGFPGMVLAIMGAPNMHLIESDQRKCAFLREVARATGTHVTLHCQRSESVRGLAADVVVARALAPLPELLTLAAPLCHAESTCLFLKGQNVGVELTETAKCWNIAVDKNIMVDKLPSASSASGIILRVKGLHRAAIDRSKRHRRGHPD